MAVTRRQFLGTTCAVTLGFKGLSELARSAVRSDLATTGFGPLIPDPQQVLDLPAQFNYTIISRVGDSMADGLRVPGDPDGMAAFAAPEGKVILIRNHELVPSEVEDSAFGERAEWLTKINANRFYDFGYGKQPALGGTTTLLFNPKTNRVEKEFLSLAGTTNNCAGGPTPWGSWISCEETVDTASQGIEKHHGYAFEVPAKLYGLPRSPQPLYEMGRFKREAVAVDPRSGIVYQTEDEHEGLVYRFIPRKPGHLSAGGTTQVLMLRDRPAVDTRNWSSASSTQIRVGESLATAWLNVADMQCLENDLRFREHANGAARFARGEGMWYGAGAVYFACTTGGSKKTGQIWRYVPSPVEGTVAENDQPGALQLFSEPNEPGLVDNADNVTFAPWGDLVICEDGSGEQFIVGVTPEGRYYKIARNAADRSEFAGSVFSPDGSILFVNMQATGLTLAITGPWRAGNAHLDYLG